jgi:phosphoserine aminotransferase
MSSTPATDARPQLAHDRVYNFSSGPCALPLEVLEEVQDELLNYRQQGMSVMEMSHRSKPVVELTDSALALVRELLAVPEHFEIIFLGGGATMQFGMVPMNLLAPGKPGRPGDRADYTFSGAWAKKAIADARTVGADVNVVFDGSGENFVTLPEASEVQSTDGSVYLHLTSNETIGGLQWQNFPDCEAPIVADMSSDFLSRPLDFSRFGLIYAGAQKNIGPAGVTVVIIRRDLLERSASAHIPPRVNYLTYANHVKADSMLNPPPVFQIYVVEKVLRWLKARGGVAWAAEAAERRSTSVYDAIATAGDGKFYRCPIDARYRSRMNVVFRLPSQELEAAFVQQATAAGLDGVKGHRSVGGCRASIYNAMPLEGAQTLADFMLDFARQRG